MEADDRDWRRLAERVTNRRNQLGLTQGGVQAAGGPSVATMRLIEGALQDGYRPNILGRLERALHWHPGSVDSILTGGEPAPIGTSPITTRDAGDYTDPETGEEYTDPDERQLWNIKTLPAEERRELIYYVRSQRMRRQVERKRQRAG